jgi:hypothetical protein
VNAFFMLFPSPGAHGLIRTIGRHANAAPGYASADAQDGGSERLHGEPRAGGRPQRRHRFGRNAQLNFKVTQETLAQFAAIADREKWLLAETLEHALDGLTG